MIFNCFFAPFYSVFGSVCIPIPTNRTKVLFSFEKKKLIEGFFINI